MTPLEEELVDLGRHLDIGSHPSVVRRVVPMKRRLLLAAAIVVLVAGLVTVIAPARRAVARWFGIGRVEIRRTPTTLPLPQTTTTTATSITTTEANVSTPSASAGRTTTSTVASVTTDPGTLHATERLIRIEPDPAIPDVGVILTYERFTLFAISSAHGTSPINAKIVSNDVSVDEVTVRGTSGFWVSGRPHEIAVIAKDGGYRLDTVRLVGNVLVWYEKGITYRIEGVQDRAEAIRIAASLTSAS